MSSDRHLRGNNLSAIPSAVFKHKNLRELYGLLRMRAVGDGRRCCAVLSD